MWWSSTLKSLVARCNICPKSLFIDYDFHSMDIQSLTDIAKQIVAPGKGILAADESTGTAGKRLASIGVENTEDNRRRYRELLFTTAGWGQYVSGVILYDETIRQKSSNGTPFVEILKNAGVIPGIKVDIGAKALAFSPDEKVTEGLDKLRERFAEYAQLGAKFAKWRAVIKIDAAKNMPTSNCLHVNAHALARYAALAQEAGLVPIVEPEVLMDGSHSIEACFDVTKRTLERVFDELDKQSVPPEGPLLKPNLVISGEEIGR